MRSKNGWVLLIMLLSGIVLGGFIGMLTANDGDDLCDLSVWEKAKTPIASFATIPGEYGPGHNSFFWDRDQNLWIAYHAVTSFEEKIVSSGMRRVYFEQDKTPRFDVIVE